MLELRPTCERCDAALPPTSLDARICTFECTFCVACAEGELGGRCPNCTGELVRRPVWEHAEGDRTAVVLRRYAEAWAAGDLEALIGCYADDFTLHYAGASRFAGTHSGRDAALAAMAEVSTIAPRTLRSVDEVLVGGDIGALVVTEELTREDESVVVERVLRYRVADGLLRECWLHEADQALVDHLWR
jgi:hypothetical protein